MATTQSNTLAEGTSAADFELMDVATGKQRSLQQLRGEFGTLIMFLGNHCPYVKHIEQGLRDLAGDYQSKGIGFAAISANDAESHPQDAPQYMAAKVFPFSYLYDESQQVARAYAAVCTPEFFVFDADLKLVYHGQFDGSRPNNDVEVSGEDLRRALDCLLQGVPVPAQQKPSMGCSIKWRA
jgi:peroxiredoxin